MSATENYIRKGFIEGRGLRELTHRGSGLTRLLCQENYESALKIWPAVDPRGYIYQRPAGEIGLREHYCNREARYESTYRLDDFKVPELVQEWITSNIGQSGRNCKSLVLSGPSRIGKTELIRSIGKHWYMNGEWDVMQVRADCDYGVLDDLVIEKFPYWKQFLGCHKQFTVTDKYHKKKQIFWGKPVVWICNEDPKVWSIDSDWMEDNVVVVRVNNKLF